MPSAAPEALSPRNLVPLHVCIDARLRSGESGGIEQFVIGLLFGIEQLDGPERYSVLIGDDHDWLRSSLSDRFETIVQSQRSSRRSLLLKLAAHPRVKPVVDNIRVRVGKRAVRIPSSSGAIEAAGVDVMHFTFQRAFLTSARSVFHPHDLQHIHLPEFFSPLERLFREVRFRAFCEQAAAVAVGSKWGKEDLVRHLELPPSKVQVVPLAPPIDAYETPSGEQLSDVASRLELPAQFIFYPAQTWPHKNHVAVLEAIARLRSDHQLRVHFVSCGRKTDHFAAIERRISALDLADQVTFLGFVDTTTLQCLYRLATAVVVPSLFEAGSFPLWEAFRVGCAAACSDVTSLPQQVGQAGLLFDPRSIESIADAIRRLWTDAELRRRLSAEGARRVRRVGWDRTAKIFRALYRRVARLHLSADDVELLRVTDTA